MGYKNNLNKTADWLLIAGGLNWGLTMFNFNLVDLLASATSPVVATVVYSAVGISAVYKLFKQFA